MVTKASAQADLLHQCDDVPTCSPDGSTCEVECKPVP